MCYLPNILCKWSLFHKMQMHQWNLKLAFKYHKPNKRENSIQMTIIQAFLSSTWDQLWNTIGEPKSRRLHNQGSLSVTMMSSLCDNDDNFLSKEAVQVRKGLSINLRRQLAKCESYLPCCLSSYTKTKFQENIGLITLSKSKQVQD